MLMFVHVSLRPLFRFSTVTRVPSGTTFVEQPVSAPFGRRLNDATPRNEFDGCWLGKATCPCPVCTWVWGPSRFAGVSVSASVINPELSVVVVIFTVGDVSEVADEPALAIHVIGSTRAVNTAATRMRFLSIWDKCTFETLRTHPWERKEGRPSAGFREFGRAHVAQVGDCGAHDRNMCRLVHLAAMGHWSKKRAVGFDE